MKERIDAGWDEDKLLLPKFIPLKMSKGEMSKEIRRIRYLKEQGRLLELPCAVGDAVWDIDFECPRDYEVTGFSFGNLNDDYCEDEVTVFDQIVVYYTNSTGSITGSFAVSEIGKTVFLSREEAEKALEDKAE